MHWGPMAQELGLAAAAVRAPAIVTAATPPSSRGIASIRTPPLWASASPAASFPPSHTRLAVRGGFLRRRSARRAPRRLFPAATAGSMAKHSGKGLA